MLYKENIDFFVKFNTTDKPFSLTSYLNSVHRSIVCSWPIFLYKNNNSVSQVQLTFLVLQY